MQPTISCLACLKHLQMCRNAYVRKRVTTWLLVLSLSLSRSLFLTYSVFLTKELCDLTSVLEIFWLSMLLLLHHWSAFLSWEPTLSFSRPLFLTHNMFLTNILCDDVGVRNILAKHGTVATSLELIFMMGTYRFTVVLRGESLQMLTRNIYAGRAELGHNCFHSTSYTLALVMCRTTSSISHT